MGSIPTRVNGIFSFILLFAYSGNETKRDVELRYLKHNASRTQQKIENGSALMGTECLTKISDSPSQPCYVNKPTELDFYKTGEKSGGLGH